MHRYYKTFKTRKYLSKCDQEAAIAGVLQEKVFLEISQNSQENNCNFIKKETLAHVFSCEFCEISKTVFFTEQLRATASWNQLVKHTFTKWCFKIYVHNIKITRVISIIKVYITKIYLIFFAFKSLKRLNKIFT